VGRFFSAGYLNFDLNCAGVYSKKKPMNSRVEKKMKK
jgi:hypothetical protein